MKNSKRILSVTVKTMFDDSPDTSWLGEYSNRPESEFAIDRAHNKDCASVTPEARKAKETLEHAQQTVADMQNDLLGYGLSNTESAEKQAEWEAFEDAYVQLGELAEDATECDCSRGGRMDSNEYRYFNGPVENYKGESDEDIRKYVHQDYERMESLNRGDWSFIGIRAEASVVTPNGFGYTNQTIHSAGLWGIESDSDESYLAEIEQEQLSELRGILKEFGFSARAISVAFKNVKEVSK